MEVNTLFHFNVRARSVTPPPAINVTPLIDVLLVLLIIFMVIQPHKEAKLAVKAPAPIDGPAPPTTLMLTVSGDMRLELNSKPVEMGELLPMLRELMEQRPFDSRTLFIKAPSALMYGPVVLLIDLAKGAGAVTVGLVR